MELNGHVRTEVEIYGSEPRCGTFLISQGFKRRHNEILSIIRKHEQHFLEAESFTDRNVKLLERRVKTKGRPVFEYLLNKTQTIFLGMLLRSSADPDDPILEFKARISKQFIQYEKIIADSMAGRQTPEWLENRATGKIIRREETDTIRDFVEYAKLQGSKNADKYYVTLSKCVNSNLFIVNGKSKNVRESMTANQLIDVKFADKIVSKWLFEGMSQNLPYKEIYQLVKAQIIAFAGIYGQSEVITKQLLIEGE